jgi:hypothetical protein
MSERELEKVCDPILVEEDGYFNGITKIECYKYISSAILCCEVVFKPLKKNNLTFLSFLVKGSIFWIIVVTWSIKSTFI